MPSDEPSKPALTHIVIGLVRNAERKILVGVRPAGQVLAGQSEFPGGKVKSNETHEAALRREVLEETALPSKAFPCGLRLNILIRMAY